MPTRPAPAQASKRRPRLAARDNTANSRAFVYLLFMFLARADRLRRAQYDEDIDLAVLAEAIGVAAIDPSMRDRHFRENFPSIDKVAGVRRQRPVNALSIATTTGIPRETTRRKIKKLLEMGVLAGMGRGKYVLAPGYLQSAPQRRLLGALTREAMRFFNECLDEDLIELPVRP
jgi:hypothetical protein